MAYAPRLYSKRIEELSKFFRFAEEATLVGDASAFPADELRATDDFLYLAEVLFDDGAFESAQAFVL